MAVILAITYMKKLGLPNFSSHSCSVSLTVEIPDVSAVDEESTKLYRLLQASVDQEIQTVGFMPDATVYGMNKPANGNGNHAPNGNHTNGNGNGTQPGYRSSRNQENWNCTDGQKGFILRIIEQHKLEKEDVETMAQELYGIGVKQLDKMQASQLIEDLLEKTGKKTNGRARWRREPARQ